MMPWVVELLVVSMVRVPQAMHRVMAPVCAAGGATGGGEAGHSVARMLQAMQRVIWELQSVLQVVQWAMVPLVMSMVWVLRVMDRVMVPLVTLMTSEGAAGIVVADDALAMSMVGVLQVM